MFGLYTLDDKLKVGLQELMAGACSFKVSRKDLMGLTEECAKVSGILYVMDAYRREAEDILNK